MAAFPSHPPTKFGVVLFPGFQALDVFGPVDILNFLAKTRPLELSILASDLNPVSTSFPAGGFGQSIVPTHTFDNAPEDIEVLLVPGGTGTRVEENIAPAVQFVKRAFPSLRYFLTVCTGSALAAQAGVLDGKRATTNKQAFKWVKSQGPNVDWVLKARWVTDGNVWTSSGVSAGIDMMFAFIADRYGDDVAETLSIRSEYRRNTDPSDDPFAKYAGVE
ncbi:putative Class I glutamine amidotransferase-like protein [Seiridium cardinale]|uniref:Class I glutamine amidotransferase-like protein n=1 Tax=Seiridium cardinale TaxID=138064 RepID=A0ABR2XHF2_9PEZI